VSLKEWGIFLDSFKTRAEADKFIQECNSSLAHMDLDDEYKFSLLFHVKPTFDNVRGGNWLYAVYMLPQRIVHAPGIPWGGDS
jgi:hypothetical protein